MPLPNISKKENQRLKWSQKETFTGSALVEHALTNFSGLMCGPCRTVGRLWDHIETNREADLHQKNQDGNSTSLPERSWWSFGISENWGVPKLGCHFNRWSDITGKWKWIRYMSADLSDTLGPTNNNQHKSFIFFVDLQNFTKNKRKRSQAHLRQNHHAFLLKEHPVGSSHWM